MFRSANNSFDTLLQKATVPTQLELDWDVTLNLCDLVRSGQVKAVYAIEQIQELLSEENPRTVLFALAVLDAVVKNCGKAVHDEVISRAFLNEMHNLATRSTNTDVRQRALEMLQCWAHGFQSKPEYDAVKDMVNLMKLQGCQFPVMTEADAMFDAACAPEWMDGSKCHRCRTEFSILNRKHHCRNCGQIFCHKCSTKQVPLLKYGIEKPVRVCDSCINELKHGSIKKVDNEGSSAGSDPGGVQLGHQQRVSRSQSESHASKRGTAPGSQISSSLQPSLPPELQEYFSSPLAKENQQPQPKTKEDELREREEVELALALSQSEIEAQKQKNKQQSKQPASQSGSMTALRGNSAKGRQQQQADDYTGSNDPFATLKPVKGILKNGDSNNKAGQNGSDNYTNELDHYLNRSLWENKQTPLQQLMMTEPSAPSPSITTDTSSVSSRSTYVHNAPTSAASMQNSYARNFINNDNVKLPKSGLLVQEQRQQNGETDVPVGDNALHGQLSSVSSSSHAEIDKFIAAMDTNIDVFTARIQSDVARGRSIHSDPTVQTLFQTITARHPDLVAYISQMDESRSYLEGLQDKITRLREAREALEALRADHQDKLRRHAEEQARLRQQQMFEKLDVLRYKKRELLDEQRRLALQRIHDQEVQLQMKLDSRRYGGVLPQQQPIGSSVQQQPYGNVMPSPMMLPYGQSYYDTTAYYNGGAGVIGQHAPLASDAPTNIPAAIQQQLQQQPHPHWTMFPPPQPSAQNAANGYAGPQPSFYNAQSQSNGTPTYVHQNQSQADLSNHQQQSGFMPMHQQQHLPSTSSHNVPCTGYVHNDAAGAAYPHQNMSGADPNRYQPHQQQAGNGMYQQQQSSEAGIGPAIAQFGKMDLNANVAQPQQQQQQQLPPSNAAVQQPPLAPPKPEEGLLISFD